MKRMMCKELAGACDTIITGSTPEEMGENAKRHAMDRVRQGDEDHAAAMHAMRDMRFRLYTLGGWHMEVTLEGGGEIGLSMSTVI